MLERGDNGETFAGLKSTLAVAAKIANEKLGHSIKGCLGFVSCTDDGI